MGNQAALARERDKWKEATDWLNKMDKVKSVLDQNSVDDKYCPSPLYMSMCITIGREEGTI